MRWNRSYAIRSYLRSSLWIVPFFALLTYLVMVRLIDVLDDWTGLPTLFSSYSSSGLAAGLQTFVTLTMSFLVFTFGSLLVAIQIAGGQLTPRIIATTLLRDKAIRFSVGLFVLFASLRHRCADSPRPVRISRDHSCCGDLGFHFDCDLSISD